MASHDDLERVVTVYRSARRGPVEAAEALTSDGYRPIEVGFVLTRALRVPLTEAMELAQAAEDRLTRGLLSPRLARHGA